MPHLPSGRHVAVDPAPLRRLHKTRPASPFNAHHIMSLARPDNLFCWLDLLLLKPADATVDERAQARPLPGAPGGLVGAPAGRLANWDVVASDWSDADCAATAAWIDKRVPPAMVRPMANVGRIQETLRKSPTLYEQDSPLTTATVKH